MNNLETFLKSSQNFKNDFLTPFKANSPKFHEQCLAYTLGSVINAMKAPALFSIVFGLLIIISPEKVDSILFDAIGENLQNTGGVIVLFSTAIIYGLILLSAKSFEGVCNLLRYVLNATSYLGYLIISVTAGIALGLIIPTYIEMEVKVGIYAYFVIVIQLVLMAVCYQLVSKSGSKVFMLEFAKGVEHQRLNGWGPVKFINSFISENKNVLRLVFGWVLILSALFALYSHEF